MANYEVSEVVVRIPWERDRWSADGATREKGLLPGPIGDYLEVVDVDPASDRVYDPVDLEDPHLLATDGLAPSEGNPKFHQQMVYAVAMTTIGHFERALGRQVFWSDMATSDGNYEVVQRLRLYPHALREENAYYDPNKKAILFGYFPARPAAPGDGLPGGVTFSCLSHDIIAHETTHAILDGLQRYYLEPNNGDVLAFHEAFADLVAVFQHFTYPEILRHQIARARGDLGTETLLGQLAIQFGRATGRRAALREFVGARDEKTGARQPLPEGAIDEQEPHARGALLVGSMFDAFLAIYRHRTRDLLRIATGGTGVLPSGDLHPDLVDRLAQEAAKAAKQLLLMCIRAIDYCPPVDITYGDYMRALITADYDLVPEDERNYRVAIIEAFRGWGIYPDNVRTLSVDSLLWERPKEGDAALQFSDLLRPVFFSDSLARLWDQICHGRVLSKDDHFRKLSRMEVAAKVKEFSRKFHVEIEKAAGTLVSSGKLVLRDKPFGLNLGYGHAEDHKFEVHQVRPVRRQAPDGGFRQDLLIQITQKRPGYFDLEQQKAEETRYMTVKAKKAPDKRPDFWFRGGVTLMLDLETFEVRYAVQKDVLNTSRLARQREFVGGTTGLSLREVYFGAPDGRDRLAALHAAED
ncbi:MAG TPA: hypothetical protein VFS60_02555 [Thermoanaerobaculia bacterium]|nr:hypothetical protein [Thermoanaerobaculia bacterium]